MSVVHLTLIPTITQYQTCRISFSEFYIYVFLRKKKKLILFLNVTQNDYKGIVFIDRVQLWKKKNYIGEANDPLYQLVQNI